MRCRQRGIALLTVMLVIAIATIAAVSMASRQHIDIRRSMNIIESDQARLFVLGVESWARQILARDRERGKIDTLDEDWATILPAIDVEGAVVSGRIDDQQGRLNLNNLIKDGAASSADIARMRRLFDALGLDPALVQAIVDWIDSDEMPLFPDGAEDNVYLGKELPYRTPNAMMTSPAELLLINGFDYDSFATLSLYVTALPRRTPVNVNTAEAPVLMALVDGLSEADAEQILSDRGDEGFDSSDAFRQHKIIRALAAKKATPPSDLDDATISVASDYFMLNASSQYGHASQQLRSLIERSDQGGRVIMRTQGVY